MANPGGISHLRGDTSLRGIGMPPSSPWMGYRPTAPSCDTPIAYTFSDAPPFADIAKTHATLHKTTSTTNYQTLLEDSFSLRQVVSEFPTCKYAFGALGIGSEIPGDAPRRYGARLLPRDPRPLHVTSISSVVVSGGNEKAPPGIRIYYTIPQTYWAAYDEGRRVANSAETVLGCMALPPYGRKRGWYFAHRLCTPLKTNSPPTHWGWASRGARR